MRTAQVTGRRPEPAHRIAEQAIKTLDHTPGKGKTEFVDKGAVHVVCAKGEDPVLIQNDAETAVRSAPVLNQRTELVLKYRLAPVSGNHEHSP